MSSKEDTKTLYTVPFEEIDQFQRHTRSYIKKLGGLKVIHALSKRQDPKKAISYTQDLVLVENLEELLYFSLQETPHPLYQLGSKSPTTQVFLHSAPQYPPQFMVTIVNQPTWRARTPLKLATPLHDLPKYPEQVLPKFDPRKGISVEDHIIFFISH